MVRRTRPGISRFRVRVYDAPRNDAETSLPLPRAAQQKHALLAKHVPEPPGQIDPQRAAVEIERDRALHLDVDLVAQLHEILDGAEMNVRRVVPGRRQIFGARHMAADQQLQPHLPEAEIRKRYDGAAADPQQIFQHHTRLPCRLQRLRQDHIVEGVVGIIDEVGVGVALHHRETLGDAAVDTLARQFDAAPVDAPCLQQLQQIAVAAADVEHLRAALDHFCHQEMIAAIMPGVLRPDAGQRQSLLLHSQVNFLVRPRAVPADCRNAREISKNSGTSSRNASWPRSVSISANDTRALEALSACTSARDSEVGNSQSLVNDTTQNRVWMPRKACASTPSRSAAMSK